MSQPFVGEIRMFGGNFAPAGWAFCDGSVLAIAENETLFQLLGTTYGGDGQSTFALPNLQGRLPVHMGTHNGSGRTFQIGEQNGVETVLLNGNQLPQHSHPLLARTTAGSAGTAQPSQNFLAGGTAMAYSPSPVSAAMAPAIQASGGSQPHDNLMPALCVGFIISLFGIFPSQT